MELSCYAHVRRLLSGQVASRLTMLDGCSARTINKAVVAHEKPNISLCSRHLTAQVVHLLVRAKCVYVHTNIFVLTRQVCI